MPKRKGNQLGKSKTCGLSNVPLAAESINAPRRVSSRQKEAVENELRRYRVLGLPVPSELLDKFIEVLGEQGVDSIMNSNTPTTATIVYQGRKWEVGETTVEPYSEKMRALSQSEETRKTSSDRERESTIQGPGEVKATETVLTNVVEDVEAHPIQESSDLASQQSLFMETESTGTREAILGAETEEVEVAEAGVNAAGDEAGRKAKVGKSLPAGGDSKETKGNVVVRGILFILTLSVRSRKTEKQRRLEELEETKRKFLGCSWAQTAGLLQMAAAEGMTAEQAEESGYNDLLRRSREGLERSNLPSDYTLAIAKSKDDEGVSKGEELGDGDEEGSSKSGQSPSETEGQDDGEPGDGGVSE